MRSLRRAAKTAEDALFDELDAEIAKLPERDRRLSVRPSLPSITMRRRTPKPVSVRLLCITTSLLRAVRGRYLQTSTGYTHARVRRSCTRDRQTKVE